MDLTLANTGSYPRIGDGPEQQQLRRAHGQWEQGKISAAEFARVQRETIAAAIEEQIAAGLDIVTDGQIRWYDPISHIAGALAGIEIDGLMRWYDTNFYFRQPVIRGKIQWKGAVLFDDFRHACSVSSKPVKPVLTGPYTLARLSLINTSLYSNLEEVIVDYSQAIAQEIRALAAGGAQVIQIDEPSLSHHPEDIGMMRQALQAFTQGKGRAALALYLYFGDAAPLYDALQTLPVDILGLDFTYSPALPDVIARNGSSKLLGLGLIDGRNTRLEKPADIFPVLEKILPRLSGERAYLNPSCGLEYLPRDRAREKLTNMADLKKEFLSGKK